MEDYRLNEFEQELIQSKYPEWDFIFSDYMYEEETTIFQTMIVVRDKKDNNIIYITSLFINSFNHMKKKTIEQIFEKIDLELEIHNDPVKREQKKNEIEGV